jgi:hypothetical protein
MEIELTMGLPCTHFKPASMTLHLELSLGAVDHDRHARDVGLGGHQIQEGCHRLLRVEHCLVHVHIDHLRTVFDLLPSDRERTRVVATEDQSGKGLRAGDIGSLADVHEQRLLIDVEWFKAGKS